MIIKINDDVINIFDISVQPTIMKHASVYLELDISKYEEYYDYFIEKYENKKVFSINSTKFLALGCKIKTIDIKFKSKMSLVIVCDVLDPDITDRRDCLLDQILNEKSQSN